MRIATNRVVDARDNLKRETIPYKLVKHTMLVSRNP